MSNLRPVQVAVDGSPGGWTALAWGARVAEGGGAPLEVLYAVPRDLLAAVTGAGQPAPTEDQVTEEALARVAKMTPDLAVTARLLRGSPQNVLPAESRAAALLVLGSRGVTGLRGWWVGSVSRAVAEHALCPVVVCKTVEDIDEVEGSPMPEGDVVVVVDPGVPALGVVDLAYRAALMTASAVRVIAEPADAADLQELLERQQARFPEIPVKVRAAAGAPEAELVEASKQAGLVVVGRPTEPSLLGNTRMGVAAHVLEKAQCPVAVVPVGRH
ncbi:universal stress protein [Kitasatospora azatica]|uniref:universal stress protein n=1 Tax=Kitasatospora azatica TaxID=58347 RepID=UPI00068E2106|nr:universal stress protein [Kitasatospora azatica]